MDQAVLVGSLNVMMRSTVMAVPPVDSMKTCISCWCDQLSSLLLNTMISKHEHKLNKEIKPNFTKTKIDPRFTISCTNVRGSKFPELELGLLKTKLDILILFETGIDCSIPVQEFVISDYPPLIAEHDHQNHHVMDLMSIFRMDFYVIETKE